MIPMDQSQSCSPISLTDDDIFEGTEAFNVTIQRVSPTANFDSDGELVIEILDKNCKDIFKQTYWHLHKLIPDILSVFKYTKRFILETYSIVLMLYKKLCAHVMHPCSQRLYCDSFLDWF